MKTNSEIDNYIENFKSNIFRYPMLIRSLKFYENKMTGCLYLYDEENGIQIFCDPFWIWENADDDKDLKVIRFYISDGLQRTFFRK